MICILRKLDDINSTIWGTKSVCYRAFPLFKRRVNRGQVIVEPQFSCNIEKHIKNIGKRIKN